MTLETFLAAHGSALILPLAVVEGPFVTLITGALSARGFFGWYWALGLLVCGDLIGDVLYYWAGRAGGGPLAGLLRRFGVRGNVSPDLQRRLSEHAFKMLVIGKWTQSIGCVVLFTSGALRVNLPRFLLANLLATVPKSALLFAAGYFAGGALPWVEARLPWAAVGLGAAGIGGVLLILCRPNAKWVSVFGR